MIWWASGKGFGCKLAMVISEVQCELPLRTGSSFAPGRRTGCGSERQLACEGSVVEWESEAWGTAACALAPGDGRSWGETCAGCTGEGRAVAGMGRSAPGIAAAAGYGRIQEEVGSCMVAPGETRGKTALC